MATQSERRLAAQSALIASAAKLFAEGGYARASVQEIGDQAGLSRGSANYHFGTKAALLEAVVDDAAERWRADMERTRLVFSVDADPAGFQDWLWAAWQSDPGRSRLAAMLIFEATAPSSDLLPKIAELHEAAVSYTRQAIIDGQATGWISTDADAEQVARSLMTVAVGLIVQSAVLETSDAEAAYDSVRGALTLSHPR